MLKILNLGRYFNQKNIEVTSLFLVAMFSLLFQLVWAALTKHRGLMSLLSRSFVSDSLDFL